MKCWARYGTLRGGSYLTYAMAVLLPAYVSALALGFDIALTVRLRKHRRCWRFDCAQCFSTTYVDVLSTYSTSDRPAIVSHTSQSVGVRLVNEDVSLATLGRKGTHSVQFRINLSNLQDLLFRFVQHIENIFVVSELGQR